VSNQKEEFERRSDVLLITAGDVAQLLKISTRTVWRMCSAGAVPQPVRFGGTVRWRLEEFKQWIAEGCLPPHSRENESQKNDLEWLSAKSRRVSE
jgi:excisionase family DNA binding protein